MMDYYKGEWKMKYYIFWFDTETTGLNPVKNDIIQIAGMIERVTDPFDINGRNIVKEFNYNIQPLNWDNIEQRAIDTHGITVEEMKKFSLPCVYHKEMKQLFGRFINPYKKGKEMYDRLIPAGYNIRFDVDMLNQLFKKQGDNYLFSNISGSSIDVFQLAIHLRHLGIIETKDMKLETLANYFNIEINVHDALSDIQATRLVYLELIKSINGEIENGK